MSLRESRRLTGDEKIFDGERGPVTVKDWWSWSYSRVRDDRIRGELAEFIVWSIVDADRNDLGSPARPYDFSLSSGRTVEVKSCSVWQDWITRKPQSLRWTITKRANTIDGSLPLAQWHADIFVFCALSETDQKKIEPLDLAQWEFYALTRRRLEDAEASGLIRLSPKGNITLWRRTLASLGAVASRWNGLRGAVQQAESEVGSPGVVR